MDAQMKKGVLKMCILRLVEQEDMYGYHIVRRVSAALPDADESTVYAILRRLRADALTEQYEGETTGGPPRKYYRITPAGRTWLAGALRDWRDLVGAVESLGISCARP